MGPGARRRDEGASLAIALVVVITTSFAAGYVGRLVGTDVRGAQAFANQRLEANTENAAANIALETLRYSSSTTVSSQPSVCWGTAPTSGLTTQLGNGSAFNPTVSYTADAWCELTAFTPGSATTRVVAIDVCASTTSASACVAQPTLAVTASFDDYPAGQSGTAPICTPTCGQSETIDRWVG